MSLKSEQEKFWAGSFGDEYITRNDDLSHRVANNTAFFSEIIRRTHNVTSVIEFGANIGINLRAIRNLLPYSALAAVEINKKATETLEQIKDIKIYQQSILDFTPEFTSTLSLIKGVLIHIAPEKLPDVYEKLYQASDKYICIAEYYNPTPVAIPYRGHTNKLFKRDFAGELLDKYKDLRLCDYGFAYKRDPNFSHDDLTWFLLEK
jgi:spore coat polysaccharide biosynthesis protein SpsF